MNTISRRKFLKIGCASAAVTVPALIPGSSLGLSGIVAPSERITMAGIGICNRGTYDLTFFLDEPDVKS